MKVRLETPGTEKLTVYMSAESYEALRDQFITFHSEGGGDGVAVVACRFVEGKPAPRDHYPDQLAIVLEDITWLAVDDFPPVEA